MGLHSSASVSSQTSIITVEMSLLEICCFNPDSAIVAAEAGADRIELCDNQKAGGTTPPIEWLKQVKSSVTIPVFVMIRPRGGDFHFSDSEFNQMKDDIDALKPWADGFVFGILDRDRAIDRDRTAELVQRADSMRCTFHRAFDETSDPLKALEDVIATGCHSILSSGCGRSVNEGLSVLTAMVRSARGRITIMPGGGVRSSNVAGLQRATGANAFHSSAIHKDSSLPDATEVRLMKQQLQQHAYGLTSQSGTIFDASLDAGATGSTTIDVPAVSIGPTPVDEQKIEL